MLGILYMLTLSSLASIPNPFCVLDLEEFALSPGLPKPLPEHWIINLSILSSTFISTLSRESRSNQQFKTITLYALQKRNH
jgi:hypothetical protein